MYKKNIDSYKYIFSLFLFYLMSSIIIYDDNNLFYIKIFVTIVLAIFIDIILFLIREKYNSYKYYRFCTGIVLLIIYVIYGLSLRSLEHHLLFGMTMSLAIIGASFFLDLELSTNKQNISEDNADK